MPHQISNNIESIFYTPSFIRRFGDVLCMYATLSEEYKAIPNRDGCRFTVIFFHSVIKRYIFINKVIIKI